MAAYEVLLLNTAIPQIQAAQSGDTYVVPRDIAINATAIISANSATDALRITQTGAGNAILVEDSANPDSTPFVVTAAGDVGVGTNSPGGRIESLQGTIGGSAFRARYNSSSYWLDLLMDANGTAVVSVPASNGVTNGALQLKTNGGTVNLDTSGNLGLGVTPSAWNTLTALQVKNSAYSATTTQNFITQNAYYATGWKYTSSSVSSQMYTMNANGNGEHAWYTAPSGTAGNAISFTQAMTLDALGNLGVGTTSPNFFASGSKGITVNGSSGSHLEMLVNGASLGFLLANANGLQIQTNSNNPLVFLTNNTERARITSGGDFLVGGHAAALFGEKFSVVAGAQNGALFKNTNQPSNVSLFWNASTAGDAQFCAFATETTYTGRGSIDYNRAGGLVRYNTTSDYRAKDILGPLQNVGATIDALKVYEGVMKGATRSRPMLIAHETQEHAPYAVSGVKDEMNADGTPKYQQMDVSSLVPLLLAEIQSLRARVKALEGA